jgi:hypothetical protein
MPAQAVAPQLLRASSEFGLPQQVRTAEDVSQVMRDAKIPCHSPTRTEWLGHSVSPEFCGCTFQKTR